MASAFTDRKGNPVIQFVAADGRRRSISMAGEKKRTVDTVKGHVEELVAAQKAARSPYDETNEWVAKVGIQLHGKLARAGLVPERVEAERAALGPFLDDYLAKLTNLKPSTLVSLTQVRNDLVDFFGAGKPLLEVTEADAEEFRRYLRTRPTMPRRRAAKRKGKGASPGAECKTVKRLHENTIRRRCGRARQLFRVAVKGRILERNPFAELQGVTVQANPKRRYFITRDEAAKVLEACPDAQWKLLFALSRYGGLRCPSEHLALRWIDVDWAASRITVHSPKTEHHDGKDCRIIPIFPELRPFLEAAWDEAEEGAEFVVTRYRESKVNMRTQFCRILKRAGIAPWPKLFQNLRSTRETELAETFPIHVVCDWIGNSEAVARTHYLQTTDAHFETAATTPTGNQRQPDLHQALQSATALDGKQSPTRTDVIHLHENVDSSSVFASIQMAKAGLEPARGLHPTGF